MESNPNTSTKQSEKDIPNSFPQEPEKSSNLVRVIKSVIFHPEKGSFVDDRVVKYKYYNAFNYSLLSSGHESVTMTFGVTSPNDGEGKTLVAANLAVSLAMGSQKKTILVDLQIHNPRLHEIFGVPSSPGLKEALQNGSISVFQTAIENLSLLTVGKEFFAKENKHAAQTDSDKVRLGLEHLPAFRDIIYSLEQEFDFVIVDMPSVRSEMVPVLFANQLHGLLIVINSGKTRKEDLDEMFRQINERQVLGFVFNRFDQV